MAVNTHPVTTRRSKNDRACRTCALYDLEYAQDSAGRIRRHAVAKCGWVSKEVMPDSVRGLPPSPSWMSPDDGTNCQCWEKRP